MKKYTFACVLVFLLTASLSSTFGQTNEQTNVKGKKNEKPKPVPHKILLVNDLCSLMADDEGAFQKELMNTYHFPLTEKDTVKKVLTFLYTYPDKTTKDKVVRIQVKTHAYVNLYSTDKEYILSFITQLKKDGAIDVAGADEQENNFHKYRIGGMSINILLNPSTENGEDWYRVNLQGH